MLTSEVPDLELLDVLLSTEVRCPPLDTSLRVPPVDAVFFVEDVEEGARVGTREGVLAEGVVFPLPAVPLFILDPAPGGFDLLDMGWLVGRSVRSLSTGRSTDETSYTRQQPLQ